MDCGHNTYHCQAPVILQGPGAPLILVPMWCATCGAIELRLPAINDADKRLHQLRTGTSDIGLPGSGAPGT